LDNRQLIGNALADVDASVPINLRARSNQFAWCGVLSLAHSIYAFRNGPFLAAKRGYPESITVDNGSEFCSRVMDAWAYRHGLKLDFIPPGESVENGADTSRALMDD
jgi:hypothetical protein